MSYIVLPISLYLLAAIIMWFDDNDIHRNTHDDMSHGH